MVLAATLLPGNGIDPGRIPPRWCLVCGEAWLTDAVSNLVLFAPLGLALALRGRSLGWIIASAAALSTGVESLQALGIPAARSASLGDICTNTLGAAVAALALRHGRRLWHPTAALAERLVIGWSLTIGLVFTVTAIALSPERSTAPPAAIRPSPYAAVPGYGWYHGVLAEVRVNATPITTASGGPVIMQLAHADEPLTLEAVLRERDPARTRRAMLFVHAPRDTQPLAMLIQLPQQTELRFSRRGSRWGLTMPVPRVRTEALPVRLEARVTTDTVRLAANQSAGVTLVLRPTIGWMLLQSVVRPGDLLAPLIQLVWLATWCVPLGWWLAYRPHTGGLAWSATVIGASLLLAPSFTGVAHATMGDWTSMMALTAAAWWSARRLYSSNDFDDRPAL